MPERWLERFWIALALKYPAVVLAVYIVLAAAASPGLLRLRYDSSPEVFFEQRAEPLERYRRFQLDFGRDQALRLAVSGPALWTTSGLEWLRTLEREAAGLSRVLGTGGLYTHHSNLPGGWPPADVESFRNQVLADVLDRNAGWVSQDGTTVTVLVVLYHMDAERLQLLLAELDKCILDAPPGLKVSKVGLPLLQRAMDEELFRFSTILLPLLLLVITVALLVVLRNLGHVLPPLLLVLVCETAVLGVMGYAGISVNLVTILLLPLMFVITLAVAVHLLLGFRGFRRKGLGTVAAALATYRQKAWPVFWTGVTTAAGFGSLAASSVPPVQALGFLTAAGIGWMTLAALTLYPALLVVAAAGTTPAETFFERRTKSLGRGLAAWSVQHRRLVILLASVSAAFWLAGWIFLRTETSLLEYFPDHHPDRRNLEVLERKGIGLVAGELILSARPRQAPPFGTADRLLQLAELSRELRSGASLLGVVSAGDILESEIQRSVVEGGSVDPGQALARLTANPEAYLLLRSMVSAEGRKARISLLVPVSGHEKIELLWEEALARARERFPGLEIQITGRYPLVLAAQRHLVRTMLLSLCLTLAVVAISLRLVVGSTRLFLVALTPNLWPVAFVLGLMGWIGIPVDSTTVMIAAVVMGLAVDDTLHTLARFRQLRVERPANAAAVTTLEQLAGAHILTAVLLIAGFSVCSLSLVVPVSRFGTLVTTALVAALAGDLVLAPAVLTSVARSSTRAYQAAVISDQESAVRPGDKEAG